MKEPADSRGTVQITLKLEFEQPTNIVTGFESNNAERPKLRLPGTHRRYFDRFGEQLATQVLSITQNREKRT